MRPVLETSVIEGVVSDADYYHTTIKEDGAKYGEIAQHIIAQYDGKRVRVTVELLGEETDNGGDKP